MVFLFILLILDIDECEDENNCDLNALCTNTDGSYICRCLRGYEGDGRYCIGINPLVTYSLKFSK